MSTGTGSTRLLMAVLAVMIGTLVTGSVRTRRDGISPLHINQWQDKSSAWNNKNGGVFGSGFGTSQVPQYTVPQYMLHPIPKHNAKQQRGVTMVPGNKNRIFHQGSQQSQNMHNQKLHSSDVKFADVGRSTGSTSPWNMPPNKANTLSNMNHCQPCVCETPIQRPSRHQRTQHFRHQGFNSGTTKQLNLQPTKPTTSLDVGGSLPFPSPRKHFKQPTQTSLKFGLPSTEHMPFYHDVGQDFFGVNAETSTHSSGEITR